MLYFSQNNTFLYLTQNNFPNFPTIQTGSACTPTWTWSWADITLGQWLMSFVWTSFDRFTSCLLLCRNYTNKLPGVSVCF